MKHPRVGAKLSWQMWWNTWGMEVPFARSSLIFFVLSSCHLLLLTQDRGGVLSLRKAGHPLGLR